MDTGAGVGGGVGLDTGAGKCIGTDTAAPAKAAQHSYHIGSQPFRICRVNAGIKIKTGIFGVIYRPGITADAVFNAFQQFLRNACRICSVLFQCRKATGKSVFFGSIIVIREKFIDKVGCFFDNFRRGDRPGNHRFNIRQVCVYLQRRGR